MDDSPSETVETSLDDFEKDFFQVAAPAETEEAPEVEENTETPSATSEVEESAEAPSASEDEDGQDDGEDTAADETGEAEEEDEAEAKPEPKKRKPARERINELTREKRDLERRLAALEAAVNRQPEKSEDSPTPEANVKSVVDEAPSPDAVDADGEPLYPLGEFDPRYIQALTKHFAEVERKEYAAKEAEKERMQRAEAAEQELTNNWTSKVQERLEHLPEDFPTKIQDLESSFRNIDPDYGEFLASTIMSLDNGPDVLNYLADNIEEAQGIVSSGATRAIIALGKLDARFEQKAEPKSEVDKGKGKTKTTQAPPPPPTTKGVGVGKPVDLSNLETFEKEFFGL